MPSHPLWIPKEKLLTYEEIARLVKIFAELGIEKIKLTGGEPLVRAELEKLVKMISDIEGIKEISMTTNGYFLVEKAKILKDSGLDSITISLHSLNEDKFNRAVGNKVFKRVMKGIEAAKEACFKSIKINSVIIKGYNDDEIIDLLNFAIKNEFIIKFIEFMPFDGNKMWGFEKVMTGEEILKIIRKKYEFTELPRTPGSTANYYTIKQGKGIFGIITSISKPFCNDCDRIRLTADGKLVPCMFSKMEFDLKEKLRSGASDEEIKNFIKISYFKKAPGVEALIKTFSLPSHIRPMHTLGG